MVFRSKIDRWLEVVIWLATAMGVFSLAGVLLFSKGWAPGPAGAMLLSLAGLALGPWILYTTYYVVGETELDARSGPFRFRVPLAEITAVYRTNNPLSSPACSLDRLMIEYGSRRLMVSPQDQAGFLAALKEKNLKI